MANENNLGVDDDDVVVVGEATGVEEVFIEDDEQDKKDKAADQKAADEERLGADPDAETDAEKEARRKARRDRRQRKKEFERRDRKELDYLRQRNLELEARGEKTDKKVDAIAARTEIGRIDSARQSIQSRIDEVDDIIAAAIENSDGSEVRRANKVRDELRDKMTELNVARQDHVRALKAVETTTANTDDDTRGNEKEETPDNTIKARRETARRNAQIFASRHDWFDGESDDSKIALKIDKELRAEGLEADTRDFWEELEDRLKEELPHRFKDADDDEDDDKDDKSGKKDGGKVGAKGGPKITGVNGQRVQVNGKSGTVFRISAERKAAMIEAGVWDDPIVRKRMLKRYAEHDKQNSRK